MIILDKPYISGFLLDTIESNSLEVVDSEYARQVTEGRNLRFVSESEAAARLSSSTDPLLYTASENSLSWVTANIPGSRIASIVEQVKNKARFRELIRPLYPYFYFREVALSEIGDLAAEQLKFPMVIKPAVGFFSLGVYVVDSPGQWPSIRQRLLDDVAKIKDLYPTAVLNTSTYLIEEVISGREFAFDAYYDANGEPVILNIMEHYFAGPDDVSDRIYITSCEIIAEFKDKFCEFLAGVNNLLGARNFVVHVEVRVDNLGNIVPIEVNPMRFGGWCTTADLTWYAYGENSYLNYLLQNRPNWQRILAEGDDSVFALVVLDNSTGVDGQGIKSFDYEKVLKRFARPLELRRANWKEYPLFGYFFTHTPRDTMSELTDILNCDLKEYCEFGCDGCYCL